MLTVFRRHSRKCRHTSRKERRCSCPLSVEGTLNGENIRRSLSVRSFEAAQKIVRDWEVRGSVKECAKIGVKEAVERFLADRIALRLREASLSKYRLLEGELKSEFGNMAVADVSLDDLRAYRESWKLAPITSRKKLERLRTFFKFCQESGWIGNNPARLLKAPQGEVKATLPFSDAEIEKILWATEVYPKHGRYGADNGKRVRAFVNLLRYSGLRIRDAVTLKREKIEHGRLLLGTQKTGQMVHLPLPQSVVKELDDVAENTEYFFWTGNGLPKSAAADWQRSLSKISTLSGVHVHAHRFRDTFSVNLLKAGVSIENVAILLGHSNSRITAKHYNPWVKSRQDSLDRDIEKAWKL